MFDKYKKQLTVIDDFDRLDAYLESLSLDSQFLEFAASVDGIRPKGNEWEITAPYMRPQIKALVGRYSKLGEEAFYLFYLPIDDTIQAALSHSSVVE